MNSNLLFLLWAALYAICGALGFIAEPGPAAGILMTMLSIVFFLPPLLLIRSGKRSAAELVRNLSIIWLVLTVLLIIGNIASVNDSILVGNILHCLLVVISSPMICSRYWFIALFGWAYLLFDSMNQLKKK